MRILFVAASPAYLLNFQSTLRSLAARGHELHVGLEREEQRLAGQREWVERLSAEYPGRVTYGPVPARRDSEGTLASHLRLGLDYLRYFHPRYAEADDLRARAGRRAPPRLRRLIDARAVHGRLGRGLTRWTLERLERALPPGDQLLDYVRERDPDALVVTPLITLGTRQTDLVRAARRLGVPTGACVYSWDNLTSKGGVRDVPDVLAVWNEAQRREAREIHGVPDDRIAVTGAQGWDHWFERAPSTTREEFAERVGLRADRPMILYLGSGGFLVESEPDFVPRWIESVRRSRRPEVRDAGIVMRAHPHSPQARWLALEELDPELAVFPRGGAMPTDEAAKADLFDSIHHCAAVVGLNTSAFVESAIVGRPVLCLELPEFYAAHGGTLHFRHLVREGGGMLRLASSFDEHRRQLEHVLGAPGGAEESYACFLEAFVRPHGLDQPATPRLVEAIESIAAERAARQPERPSAGERLTRAVLLPVADALLVERTKTVRQRLARGLRRRGRRLRRARRRMLRARRLGRHAPAGRARRLLAVRRQPAGDDAQEAADRAQPERHPVG